MQGTTGVASVQTVLPSKIEISNRPVDLMSLNVGVSYACSKKIADFISSIPLHVYVEVPKDKVDKIINNHRILSQKELSGIRTSTKTIKMGRKGTIKTTEDTVVVELTEHNLVDLLHRPNNDMAWSDWVSIVSTYLSVLGNAYILIERETDGTIIGLRPLLSEYVWLNTNASGQILAYEYYPSNQEFLSRKFDPKDILHIKSPSCGSILAGRGVVEAVQKEIRLIEEINNHMLAIASNVGQPGVIVTIHGKVGSQEEADKIADKFVSKWSKLRRGLPLINFSKSADDSIDIKQSGINPKDMVYDQHFDRLRSVIAAAYGVPEDMIKETGSRAGSVTSIQNFISFAICPRLNSMIEQINHKFYEEFDGVFLGYRSEELVESDPTQQSVVLRTYVTSGIMTPNEARETLELEPIEEGDQLKASGNSSNSSSESSDGREFDRTTPENSKIGDANDERKLNMQASNR
jgi:HK97 family phage portal protein